MRSSLKELIGAGAGSGAVCPGKRMVSMSAGFWGGTRSNATYPSGERTAGWLVAAGIAAVPSVEELVCPDLVSITVCGGTVVAPVPGSKRRRAYARVWPPARRTTEEWTRSSTDEVSERSCAGRSPALKRGLAARKIPSRRKAVRMAVSVDPSGTGRVGRLP